MPWVRLDDRFPSHRKVALLSDRAFRLYISALCWSSENLTEGKVLDRELPLVARGVRGAKKTATELEGAGLWDRIADGWQIHDFLEYNPDRAKVKAEREANAARQKAWRDRKRAEREAKRAAEEAERDAHRNAVTPPASDAENDASATRRRHDGDTTATRRGPENHKESQVSEVRNAVSNGTPCPPPSASPLEKQASRQDSALIPDWARPLIDALSVKGIAVSWTRTSNLQWVIVQQLMASHGIPYLVFIAASRWNPDKPIKFGKLLIDIWREFDPPAPGSPWHPDATSASGTPAPEPPPMPDWCGKCDSPDYRWLERDGREYRCTTCNPDVIGAHT